MIRGEEAGTWRAGDLLRLCWCCDAHGLAVRSLQTVASSAEIIIDGDVHRPILKTWECKIGAWIAPSSEVQGLHD